MTDLTFAELVFYLFTYLFYYLLLCSLLCTRIPRKIPCMWKLTYVNITYIINLNEMKSAFLKVWLTELLMDQRGTEEVRHIQYSWSYPHFWGKYFERKIRKSGWAFLSKHMMFVMYMHITPWDLCACCGWGDHDFNHCPPDRLSTALPRAISNPIFLSACACIQTKLIQQKSSRRCTE